MGVATCSVRGQLILINIGRILGLHIPKQVGYTKISVPWSAVTDLHVFLCEVISLSFLSPMGRNVNSATFYVDALHTLKWKLEFMKNTGLRMDIKRGGGLVEKSHSTFPVVGEGSSRECPLNIFLALARTY